ncbi:carboxymuconolactone decarboxylase family protein [Streptomyces sp. NPDC002911]
MSDRTRLSPPRRIFIDKQSPEVSHALVQVSEAVRAAPEAGLDHTTTELSNLRVSQLDGCAYCLDVHTRAVLCAGESPQRIGILSAWRDAGLVTPSERAALALAEATTDPVNATTHASAHEAVREALFEDQISAAIRVALTINACNRVSIMSKHPVPSLHNKWRWPARPTAASRRGVATTARTQRASRGPGCTSSRR